MSVSENKLRRNEGDGDIQMKFGGDFTLRCNLMDKVQLGGDRPCESLSVTGVSERALASPEALMVAIHQRRLCLLSLLGRAPPDAT